MSRTGRIAGVVLALIAMGIALLLVLEPARDAPPPGTAGSAGSAPPPQRRAHPTPPSPPMQPPSIETESATLVARVVSWEGEPVPGALVEVAPHEPYVPDADADYAPPAAVARSETGTDGTTHVPGLDLDTALRAVVVADGYANAERLFHTPANPGDVRVTIRLLAGQELTGRVLDPDGEPVEDAVVRIAQGQTSRTTSGPDGRYVLTGLAPGAHSVQAARAGARPLEVARVRVPLGSDLDIVLAPLARLEGTVRDRDTGEPLPGAEVTAGIWFGYRGLGRAVTDAEGRYAIVTLPGGVVNRIGARLDGYRGPGVRPGPRAIQVALRAGETTRHDLELFRSDAPRATSGGGLPAGGDIVGRVLDPEGSPIVGVRVGSVRSDAEGRFRLQPKGPGTEMILPIDHPGFAGAELRVSVPPAGSEIERDVTLAPAPVVRGVVRMPDGTLPPAGTSVSVRVMTGRQNPPPRGGPEIKSRPSVPVEPDGSYRAELPWLGGRPHVEPQAPGMPRQRAQPVEYRPGTAEYEVDLLLEQGGTASGTVLDAATGRPVAGARVRAGAPVTTVAVTDAEGRFRARHVPVGSIGPNGAPGRWSSLSVESPDHLPWSGSVEQPDPGDLVVRLQPALRIRGRVTWPDGTPAASVRVFVDRHWIVTVTDHDGAFVLRRVAPGRHAVHVEGAAPGMDVRSDVVADVPAGTHDLEIVVRRGGKISGRVVDPDGAGVPDVNVTAVPTGERTPVHHARTDGQGAFVVSGLAPGVFDVVARPNPHSPYTESGRTQLPAYRAAVPADTEDLELVLGSGESVSGVLVDGSGKAYPNVWLRAGGRTAVTDGAGRFRFDGLPTGTHRIVVQRGTGGPVTLEGGDAVAAGTRDLRLIGRAGVSQAGIVLAPDGTPLSGATVEVLRAGRVSTRTTTDAGGEFAFANLHPGELVLIASARDLVPYRLELVAGAASATLRLERGLEARGRLLDEGGEPLAGVWISLDVSDRPHLRREARTDADGRFTATGMVDAEYTASVRVDRDGRMTRVEVGSLRPGENAELRRR